MKRELDSQQIAQLNQSLEHRDSLHRQQLMQIRQFYGAGSRVVRSHAVSRVVLLVGLLCCWTLRRERLRAPLPCHLDNVPGQGLNPASAGTEQLWFEPITMIRPSFISASPSRVVITDLSSDVVVTHPSISFEYTVGGNSPLCRVSSHLLCVCVCFFSLCYFDC